MHGHRRDAPTGVARDRPQGDAIQRPRSLSGPTLRWYLFGDVRQGSARPRDHRSDRTGTDRVGAAACDARLVPGVPDRLGDDRGQAVHHRHLHSVSGSHDSKRCRPRRRQARAWPGLRRREPRSRSRRLSRVTAALVRTAAGAACVVTLARYASEATTSASLKTCGRAIPSTGVLRNVLEVHLSGPSELTTDSPFGGTVTVSLRPGVNRHAVSLGSGSPILPIITRGTDVVGQYEGAAGGVGIPATVTPRRRHWCSSAPSPPPLPGALDASGTDSRRTIGHPSGRR